MREIFTKIDLKFYLFIGWEGLILILQLTTKLMNKFSYSITTHFILGNKDYHSCCNPHSVYQTYPRMSNMCFDHLGSEIFPKIDHKFYSNITTHNQTNE